MFQGFQVKYGRLYVQEEAKAQIREREQEDRGIYAFKQLRDRTLRMEGF